MTDTEKKMKRYLKAVRRHLNLPREVKDRVMSDFAGSVEARAESGMTWDQIAAELGTPKKAAAELNEQMKEYCYRKSPWRFLFLIPAVYGAAELLSGIWVYVIYWLSVLFMELRSGFVPGEAYSVGIIGGADGPTAIFLTSPGWMHYITPVILLAVGIIGFLRLSRCTRK